MVNPTQEGKIDMNLFNNKLYKMTIGKRNPKKQMSPEKAIALYKLKFNL